MWNRTLVYLGLREEPEEVYDELPPRADEPDRGAPRAGDPGGGAGRVEEPVADDNVRPLRTDVRVRTGPPVSRTAVVEVTDFEDVEAIGARYRTGQSVLFDAAGADTATARRVLDFVSGLTYALRGRLEKVGGRSFLLVPDGVELADDERRRLGDLGYRLPTGSEG